MSVRRRPLVVLDDPAVTADVLAEVAGAGWTLVAPSERVGVGDCLEWSVRTPDDVPGAVLAAAAGAGVVVRVEAPAVHEVGDAWLDLVDDLAEDLASLGPVLRPRASTAVALDRLTWQLVHDLARGLRLEAAAARAYLSLRTANRRVSEARAALGAGSRAELVVALRSPGRVPAAPIIR